MRKSAGTSAAVLIHGRWTSLKPFVALHPGWELTWLLSAGDSPGPIGCGPKPARSSGNPRVPS